MKPPGAQRLHAVPLTQRAAQTFIAEVHRHNRPPRGDVIRVGAALPDGTVVAVGCAGRPVARGLDDGRTLEITRVASIGTMNATSFVYRSLARAAFALGWDRVITYTQHDEGGASMRAAGFRVIAARPARPSHRGWDCSTRPREADYNHADRVLWEAS